MATNGRLAPLDTTVYENLILDTKIMIVHAQEPEIEHFWHFMDGHFEIQDGHQI